jgi:hypothetical protein
MTERWQRELHRLSSLEPSRAPWETPRGVIDLATVGRARSHGRLVPGVIAAALVVGIVGGLLVAGTLGDRRVDEADIGTTDPIGGRVLSLQEAIDAVSFEVYRPQDPVASDSSLSRVWVSTRAEASDSETQAAVRLEYASGLVVTLTEWLDGQDPAASYRAQWEESGGLGSLTMINGHPAWVLPGTAQPSRSIVTLPGTSASSGVADPSVNVVELSIGNVDILLRGSMSVDTLLRVASTIQ